MHESTSESTVGSTQSQPKRYLCRHIFTEGHRCGSPALRGEPFCYYHHTTRRPITRQALGERAHEGSDAAFHLAMPEDRHALHLTLADILQRVAEKRLDPKRAKLILQGLQIVRTNLPPQREAATPKPIVEDIVHDLNYGNLAPPTEIPTEIPAEMPAEIPTQLSANIPGAQSPTDEAPSKQPMPPTEPEPDSILPSINAVAESGPDEAAQTTSPTCPSISLPSSPTYLPLPTIVILFLPLSS